MKDDTLGTSYACVWAGSMGKAVRRVRVDYIGSAVPLPPPLKPEEERALVEAIEAGDSSAKGTADRA